MPVVFHHHQQPKGRGRENQVPGSRLQVSGCRFQVAGSRFLYYPVTCNLKLTFFCMLFFPVTGAWQPVTFGPTFLTIVDKIKG